MDTTLASRENILIQKMFDTLTEQDKIVDFMIDYFKAFIVSKSRPTNLDFQSSIDAVNKDLLLPLRDFTDENLKDLDKAKEGKIKMWSDAHKEFEIKVIREIKNFAK